MFVNVIFNVLGLFLDCSLHMSSVYLSDLCSAIIEEHFGSNAGQLVRLLLQRGSLPLGSIIIATKLKILKVNGILFYYTFLL